MNNDIYFRRRRKICLSKPADEDILPLDYIASLLKNLEPLGFTFSQKLIESCRALSVDQLIALYDELMVFLPKATGAHREFRPMYPNFPAQVMAMEKWHLYINAIIHYATWGQYLPLSEKEVRIPLLDNLELTVIDLGTAEEFESLCTQIASSASSISQQDREDLAWFTETYGDDVLRLLPEVISHKENMAALACLLIKHTSTGTDFITRCCSTATDILRVAVALSEGDVSLALPARFRTFSRAERRLLLDLLNRQPAPVEDMLRWKTRWIRLGEKLHPGEFRERYFWAATAFDILRNDLPYPTFNNAVEKALASRDIQQAITHLISRPGDFARRLDHLLRIDESAQNTVVKAFGSVADSVATPVLLQAMQHFKTRGNAHDNDENLRVFFPKGDLAKVYAIENNLPELPSDICAQVVAIISNALVERFRLLPPLGACYLDTQLAEYLLPFSQRSASKSLRTLVRGSRLPLPENCRVLRFFVWWKNGDSRTDIDLSAAMFDKDFGYRDTLSYYNLKNFGGCHSGDIVDAPEGASEFIDITLDKIRAMDIRYVVMVLNSFTQQPYSDLPECFAGWMARTYPESGEIYEPVTVRDRIDITANTSMAIPLIIDLQDNKVIWSDVALRQHPLWSNNVHENKKGINLTLQVLTSLNKPALYDLFDLHIKARGHHVQQPELADTVFSVDNEIPYRLEEIAASYMQ